MSGAVEAAPPLPRAKHGSAPESALIEPLLGPLRAVLGALPFICIDLGFFLANSVKIPDGGWFPLAFGLTIFVLLNDLEARPRTAA